MKCVRLVAAGNTFDAQPLPLRMPHASGVVDPEPFRLRARGDGPALLEAYSECGGMRTLHLPHGASARLFDVPSATLTLVVSGRLAVRTSPEEIVLGPGDLLLVPASEAAENQIATDGDCRLLQVFVDGEWPGDRARPLRPASTLDREGRRVNLKRMYKGADAKSYFREFDGLFGSDGCWSEIKPVIGLRFISMAADTFIDWHPEIVNNFVFVMAGGLELEVGGGRGATEVFWPGDVCLAEDRTGEGHIDRVHGDVQVAVLIIDDSHLWP